MTKKKIISLFLSISVSAVLLALLLTRIKTEDLVGAMKNIHVPFLAAYAGASLSGAFFRAWRYKRLLLPRKIGWGPMLLVTFIRNSLVDLLPARIGSLSYIYVLNARLGFPFESAASTFVLCLVLDLLTIGPFLMTAVFAVGIGSNALSGPGLFIAAALFFLFFLLILWRLVPLARRALAVLESIGRHFHWERKKSFAVAVGKTASTIDAIEDIRRKKSFFPVFLLSLLIRLTKYVSLTFLFFALLRSFGQMPRLEGFWKVILGNSGAEITSVLPIKGLAGFGTWESAWALTYHLLGFDSKLSILSGMGVHLITNLFEYSLGAASILLLFLPFIKIRSLTND